MRVKSEPRCVLRRERIVPQENMSNTLELHNKEVHTEVRPYKCETCGKEFKWEYNLCRHKRIHRGERPYQCELCEKTFTQKVSLDKHKKAMHMNKNYKCTVCGKGFKTQQNLRCHTDTDHPRERLYKCNQCLSVFIRHYSLNNHINRVHIDKKHLCKICGKAFRTKYHVDQHNAVHSDKKPYECAVCGKVYKRNQALQSHMRIKHTSDTILEEQTATDNEIDRMQL